MILTAAQAQKVGKLADQQALTSASEVSVARPVGYGEDGDIEFTTSGYQALIKPDGEVIE